MEAGSIFAEHYQLLKLIGEGSFGNVWLAKDLRADLAVAIKIYVMLDERGAKEFMDEFKLTFNLNHTHILHAYHYDVFAKQPFLVMPYCEKGSVLSLIGNIREEQLWHFLADVSAGLAYLHGQRPNPIVHQDIKPDNILIGKDGTFLVTDFGISQQMRSTLRRNSSRTPSAGSTAYMPPERFLSKPASTSAGDIWSLGVTLVELATGELPFCGMGGNMQNGGAELPILPTLSEELQTIVYGCLAKNSNERPTAEKLSEWCHEHFSSKDSDNKDATTPSGKSRKDNTVRNGKPVATGGGKPDKTGDGSDWTAVASQLIKRYWITATIIAVVATTACCWFCTKSNDKVDSGSIPLPANCEALLPGAYTCKQINRDKTVNRKMVAKIKKTGDEEYTLSIISSDFGTTHSTFRRLPDGDFESEKYGKGSATYNPKLRTMTLTFEEQGVKLELFK